MTLTSDSITATRTPCRMPTGRPPTAAPRRLAAHLIGDGRAGAAGGGGKPRQQTGADIGHANGGEFLIGGDLLSVPGGEDARGENLIRIDEDPERKRGRQQQEEILKAEGGGRQ